MPPGRSTRAISVHHTEIGWRLVTRSNASSANGNGGSSRVATTTTPSGCKRLVARAAFGRPRFDGRHGGRERPRAGQHLAAAGLNVQRGRHGRQTAAQQPLVAPGRSFLGRAAVEPGEVPAVDGYRIGLGHQIFECATHVGHGRHFVLANRRRIATYRRGFVRFCVYTRGLPVGRGRRHADTRAAPRCA